MRCDRSDRNVCKPWLNNSNPRRAGSQITQGVELEEAARNFALLLVIPWEVDVVQIVSQGHDRRWQWKLLDDMSWAATELVP